MQVIHKLNGQAISLDMRFRTVNADPWSMHTLDNNYVSVEKIIESADKELSTFSYLYNIYKFRQYGKGIHDPFKNKYVD